MKRDKKYLLIIDDHRGRCWYKKLSISCVMNAKIILQTYYKYTDISKYNRVIISNNKYFKDYKSEMLENGYIENRVDDFISIINK